MRTERQKDEKVEEEQQEQEQEMRQDASMLKIRQVEVGADEDGGT